MAESRWIIIALSEVGDRAGYEEIENAIVCIFGEDSDYFIPIYHEKMGSYTSTSILFEGYVFVKDSFYIRENIPYVREHRIFSGALENRRKIQTVDSKTIGRLRRKLKNSTKKKIKPGSMVRVTGGIFENLVGEVVSMEDGGKKVMVKIKRLSREMIAPIPSTSMREVFSEEVE